jgi:hypothetical protein
MIPPSLYVIIGVDPWGHSLKLLMAAVMAGGGVVMGLMAFMQVRMYVCVCVCVCVCIYVCMY